MFFGRWRKASRQRTWAATRFLVRRVKVVVPSANVAEVVRRKCINKACEFSGVYLAKRIRSENGQADAFLRANAVCHISAIHSVMGGVKLLSSRRSCASLKVSISVTSSR